MGSHRPDQLQHCDSLTWLPSFPQVTDRNMRGIRFSPTHSRGSSRVPTFQAGPGTAGRWLRGRQDQIPVQSAGFTLGCLCRSRRPAPHEKCAAPCQESCVLPHRPHGRRTFTTNTYQPGMTSETVTAPGGLNLVYTDTYAVRVTAHYGPWQAAPVVQDNTVATKTLLGSARISCP